MKYPKGFEKNELLPAVMQDYKTKQVVMLAYMNKNSYKKTVETKTTWFWSRSRNELWNKGATSGNTQNVRNISFDCDEDSILIEIDQLGKGACHTGSFSCFNKEI